MLYEGVKMRKPEIEKKSLLSERGNLTRKAILTALVERGITISYEDFLFLEELSKEEFSTQQGNAAEQLKFL